MDVFCKYGNKDKVREAFYNKILMGKSISDIALEDDMLPDSVVALLTEGVTYDKYVADAVNSYYQIFKVVSSRILVIADTHIGGSYEDFRLINAAYDFAEKNEIDTVIHCGDIIEGKSNSLANGKDETEQVKILKSNYPIRVVGSKESKRYINTLYIYGNHDYNLRYYNNYDLKDALKDYALFTYLGAKTGYIYDAYNQLIKITHDNKFFYNIPDVKTSLTLEGHHHLYRINEGNNVYVPPLTKNYGSYSGFIDLGVYQDHYQVDLYGFDGNLKAIRKDSKILSRNI